MESKELLENIKNKIIEEVFNNDKISLEEKIHFCQDLENFGETWRNLIFAGKLEVKKETEKYNLWMESLK